VSTQLNTAINSVLNDSSLTFSRVNDHIHKKVPVLVQEKVICKDTKNEMKKKYQKKRKKKRV
jgi:hypothetical protein